jgi:spore germination protein YaaH
MPTISTGWDNGSRLLRILSDPKLRAEHINAIMNIARMPNIDGIDLDYENLPPEARRPYTDFVTALAAALHREGKLLSVTVPPKVRADDPCVFCKFADYSAIGVVADRFRVMAYEYHGKSGAPGPIAPVWWMREVMSYTVSVVPHDKVSLGIHLYGYDWGGKETPALWWNEVQALRDQYGGEVRYADPEARGVVGESVMTYTVTYTPRCLRFLPPDDCPPPVRENHTVWFVDARYIAESMKIVQDYGLGGIVLWRPGGEDPAIWNALAPSSLSTPRFDNESGF